MRTLFAVCSLLLSPFMLVVLVLAQIRFPRSRDL